MRVKLPIGLLHGKPVFITDDIPNGLACQCTCPACGAPLIAYKKVTRKTQYFGHKPKSECSFSNHALQTALHYAGKEIIEKARGIRLPVVLFNDLDRPKGFDDESIVLRNEYWLPIDEVVLERKDGDIIPDIVVICKDGAGNLRKLYVEIAVTHFVRTDEVKLQKVRSRQLPMIEIDLSGYKLDWGWNKLREEIIIRTEKKTWIFNQHEYNHRNEVESRRQEILATRAAEESARIKEIDEKLNRYQSDRSLKVFTSCDLPRLCPQRQAARRKLMETSVIKNDDLLMEILTHGDWNGEIYDTKHSTKRWIVYEGQTIIVYPAHPNYRSSNMLMYRGRLDGLNLIGSELFRSGLFECYGCLSNADYFDHEGTHYEVCRYPKTIYDVMSPDC